MAAGLGAEIARILVRNLEAMKEEIGRYPSDDAVWELRPGIANSAGTLALHGAGNLLHYVGAAIGDTGYVRDRDREFSERGLSRAELRRRLEEAIEVVEGVLPSLSDERLHEPFPATPDAYRGATVSWFLVHLTSHLAYHLGQVNYHRRLLSAP